MVPCLGLGASVLPSQLSPKDVVDGPRCEDLAVPGADSFGVQRTGDSVGAGAGCFHRLDSGDNFRLSVIFVRRVLPVWPAAFYTNEPYPLAEVRLSRLCPSPRASR